MKKVCLFLLDGETVAKSVVEPDSVRYTTILQQRKLRRRQSTVLGDWLRLLFDGEGTELDETERNTTAPDRPLNIRG